MSFVQPDNDVVQALALLDNDPNFEKICSWFRDIQAKLDTDNRVIIDDVAMRQNQGASQLMTHILKNSESARRTYASIRSRQDIS